MFDILGSMGGVADATILDLFCGSGALGIEALSRGAASVLFVDGDQAALNATRANLVAVGLEQEAVTFQHARLPNWQPPVVDIVLADPPYDFAGLDATLALVQAEIAVVESREALNIPNGWVSHRQRRYGGTLVTVMTQEQSGANSQ